MALDELDLKNRYRTGRDDLVNDFYVPVLSEATLYRRAVGYFSSGSLALAAQGLNRLIARGGAVQLVASPQFSAEDIEALRRGVDARDDIIQQALLRELVADEGPQRRRLEYVAWLLAQGRLEIRIALMRDPARGIFHEKFGLISDGQRTIAFSGSANETLAAHVLNFESFSVFRDWMPVEDEWVADFAMDFAALWENATPELEVVDLPSALTEGLLKLAPSDWHSPPPDPDELEASGDEEHYPLGRLRIPNSLTLRPYQKDAIRAWFAAGGRGIFELATGTGKTITALALTQRLESLLWERHEKPLLVIVVVPFLNLVAQWSRELREFGVWPLVAAGDSSEWSAAISTVLSGLRAGSVRFVVVVTTNKSFALAPFQGLLADIPAETLVIADEVHNMGTSQLGSALPTRAAYHLGLSATPERWADPSGTDIIRRYFGDSVAIKTIGEAIEEKFLTPYDYYPLVVELDEDEQQEYLELSEKIARLAGAQQSLGNADQLDGPLKMLLFKRARLVAAARRKLPLILDVAHRHKSEGKMIVYCSDASNTDGDPGASLEKQLEQVLAGLCLPPVSMSAARYTHHQSAAERAQLELQFARGALDALVAIRCLDEGVDIPSMQTAIIAASTTNPRQFIQRRGRVLRRFPGKDHATIYDLVVSPGDPAALSDTVFNVERRLFRKELARVVEFARSARNEVEAMHDLLPLRQAWNCLDI